MKTTMEVTQMLTREEWKAPRTVRLALLFCGILSSLLYLAMNIVFPLRLEGYNVVDQTVSELSAIGTSTRPLWVLLGAVYSILAVAFGLGVWESAGRNRRLRVVGALLAISAIIGAFWPPMHQREVLAAGEGTLTDILHIVFTAVTVPLVMVAIGFAATAFGKGFRLYSIASIVIMIGFGVLTGLASPDMEANLPTPWMGVWERIGIGAQMLWIAVLAIILLRSERGKSPS
jgi:hypothetical protein